MNTKSSYLRMIDWILAVSLLISACTRTQITPAAQALPNATPQPVLPTATLPQPTPTIGIPGGHTTTTWSVETNLAYDALCFIPTLTGDPFYLRFYQSEYNRFAPKLQPAVKQALDEIRAVVKEHDSLLSSTLVSLFLPLAPKNLNDLSKALENPDVIRLGAGLKEDDQTWLLILSHIPDLQIVVRWLQEVGFEKDYAENIYPQVLKKAEELNENLPQYNIIPVIEVALGEVLPTNHFTMYLAHYPMPFGLGLDANISLFSSDLPLSGIVDNSIHENLHLLDIQEKELWEALSFLQQDEYYMNNFKIHDPNGGYMVYEEFLEEDVVEALDQFLAEKFDVAENPRTRWGSQPTGTHTLSPVLYTLLNQENYSPEKETYHDFLIRMIREGKIKAGTIEEANRQFYANRN
jgi:hypothetical protein